jgi:redox-sensitive bicupin YhaK (pirin superfamily)
MHERDSMDRSRPAKLEKGQPMSNLESQDKTATRPLAATVMTQNSLSRIARRTRGQSHGPMTRLMSPSDFGRLLKPFVFLDLFETQGNPFTGFGLHPHSGIATLTYVAEGSVSYQDTNGATGLLPAGGIEWMRAGGGVWHGGGTGESGRTRGFQLWIALPPELELGSSESTYLSPEVIPHDGPARVLLGSYGTATSAIKAPSPMNYLAVHLKAGERWSYQPPAGHTVLWTAVGKGSVLVPDELSQGELVAFTPSSAVIEFEAQSDAEFVLGSAVPHDYDLVLGSHSVHTSTEALCEAEARISEIQTRLIQEGKL